MSPVRLPGERRRERITYYRPPWPAEIIEHHRGDIVSIDGDRWELVGYFTRTRRPHETITEEFGGLVLDVHLIEPLDEEPISG